MIAIILACALFGGSNAQAFNVDTTNIDDFGLWHDPVVRPWHLIGIYDPNQDPEAQRAVYEERQEFTVNHFNMAMSFHQVPIRIMHGEIHMMNSDLWDLDKDTCGDSLEVCKKWSKDLGRADGQLDWWMCILPNSYLPNCHGMANRPGEVAIVSETGFRNPQKIGSLHEMGHNLGCENMNGYCAAGAKTLTVDTGNNYLTVMGGGDACTSKSEHIRLPYYTDARKTYCENNNCIQLGDENFDCAQDMIVTLNHWISTRLPPKCPANDFQGACLVKENTTCKQNRKLGVFSNVGQCADYVKKHPSRCPSGKFSWSLKRQDLSCRCCSDGDEKYNDNWDLYKPTDTDSSKYSVDSLDNENDFVDKGNVLENARPELQDAPEQSSDSLTYGLYAGSGFLFSFCVMLGVNMYNSRKTEPVDDLYTRQI